MASPELWHAEYKCADESDAEIEFHIWSYGCEPQAEKFVEDHIAFSKAQISTSSPSPPLSITSFTYSQKTSK